MTSEQPGIVFVHAHPDDETIFTGATIAHYAARGVRVTVVICTLGEEGEIYVPSLSGLAAAEADQLGGYRLSELFRAAEELGVTDVRLLGGAGRYRDSGMPGTPANDHPRAWTGTPVADAAAHLAAILAEVRPQVVVTYGENGLTDHPDHIHTHRVTMAALAQLPAEVAPDVYFPTIPESTLTAGFDKFRATAENPFEQVPAVSELPFVSRDDRIAVRIDASKHGSAKLAALSAHATQIRTDTWLYALATNLGVEPVGVEYYRSANGHEGIKGELLD